MISPNYHPNEALRMDAVRSYGLLDTLPEEEYDQITKLIASICETPISLVAILDTDRNFFKSHHGISFNESPRDISFCGHAILEPENLFIVEDARLDPRFNDNPLVQEENAIFYAGAPLFDSNGLPLGTLCIFDTKPRVLSDTQKEFIIAMARQVVKLFELNKHNIALENAKAILELRNKELKEFAGVVSHDLKSPLANITSLARLLKDEYAPQFDENGNQYIDYIEESSYTLKKYIDGMLEYYKSDEILDAAKETTSLLSIFQEIEDILFIDNAEFEYNFEDTPLFVNRAAVVQILLNLVGNALKYNHSKIPHVSATFSENDYFYYFSVEDNGVGINKDKQQIIFDLFKTVDENDRHGNKGSGIGLATVKSLVEKMGGEIVLNSIKGEGTTFSFSIKK